MRDTVSDEAPGTTGGRGGVVVWPATFSGRVRASPPKTTQS